MMTIENNTGQTLYWLGAALYDPAVGFTDQQRDQLLLQYLRHSHIKEKGNNDP